MKSFPVLSHTAAIPGGDASGEHRLDCGGVESPLQRCGDFKFPQPSEVIQPLPRLLHQGGDVGGSCQVLGDVDDEVPVSADSIYRDPIDPERGVMAPLLLLSNVHNLLLGFEDVQVQFILLASRRQCIQLFQIGRLPVVGDQAYHHCVVRELNNDIGGMSGFAVVGVEVVEQRTQDTALGGANIEGAWTGGVASYPHHLWSTSQEALDPGAE